MDALPTPNPPHDRSAYYTPHHSVDSTQIEIERLTHQFQIQQQKQTRTQRNITRMYFNDHTNLEIQHKLETTLPTIRRTLGLPRTLRTLSIMQQLNELRGGPSSDDRRNMAWRIAQHNEQASPSVALKAIDLLNKQSGEYIPEETKHQGITINVQNFTIANTQPQQPAPIKDITPSEFQPVTIEVNPSER